MDPLSIAAVGTLLGGVGGLASAVLPTEQGSSNTRIEPWTRFTWAKSYEESKRRFDDVMDTTIQRRVADAKKAGLHPLFALGGSPGSVGFVPGGMHFATSNVDDPYSLPKRVQSASSSLSKMARAMFDLDYRSKEMDVAMKEIEVQRMASELARRDSPGAPPVEAVPYTHIQAKDPDRKSTV